MFDKKVKISLQLLESLKVKMDTYEKQIAGHKQEIASLERYKSQDDLLFEYENENRALRDRNKVLEQQLKSLQTSNYTLNKEVIANKVVAKEVINKMDEVVKQNEAYKSVSKLYQDNQNLDEVTEEYFRT